MDHRHRVPADQRLHPLLEVPIAWVLDLVMLRDGVVIRRGQLACDRHPRLARTLPQRLEQLRTLLPVGRNDVVERLNPLRDLCGKILLYGFVNLRRHRSHPCLFTSA